MSATRIELIARAAAPQAIENSRSRSTTAGSGDITEQNLGRGEHVFGERLRHVRGMDANPDLDLVVAGIHVQILPAHRLRDLAVDGLCALGRIGLERRQRKQVRQDGVLAQSRIGYRCACAFDAAITVARQSFLRGLLWLRPRFLAQLASAAEASPGRIANTGLVGIPIERREKSVLFACAGARHRFEFGNRPLGSPVLQRQGHRSQRMNVATHTTVIPSARYELRFQLLFNEGRAPTFRCDADGRVDLDAMVRAPCRSDWGDRPAAALMASGTCDRSGRWAGR